MVFNVFFFKNVFKICDINFVKKRERKREREREKKKRGKEEFHKDRIDHS